MLISAVIPTKNRPDDLVKAVASILQQRRIPDELMIVDQSEAPESRERVTALCHVEPRMRLTYIQDPSIAGLVAAKHFATTRVLGDFVCFLEDDVVLEPDYFAAIEGGFAAVPQMVGCSGMITNPPASAWWYVAAHGVFFRGIFADPRVRITTAATRDGSALIQSDVLSGGLSCWRREVFSRVQFDPANGFFMLEDMEFASRVVREFGRCLYINPAARLAHYGSPVNRDVHGLRQQRKAAEAMVFFRKRRTWPGANTGLAFALTWWFAEAAFQALRARRFGPIAGFCRGLSAGAKQPLRSTPQGTA